MAWAVLEEDLERFCRGQAERSAAPSVVALRRHFEAIRRSVLAGGAGDAEAVTRLLVNKLLHDPSEVLRRAAAEDPQAGAELERSLRRLFALAPEAEESEEEK